MRQWVKKPEGGQGDASCGAAERILIHAGLFLLAGMLGVFTVVKKKEPKFVPPKTLERPKMKLRKPKMKVKKTTKPKPTTRIWVGQDHIFH